MNCEKIKTLISLYLDHQLSDEERSAVDEHLLHCNVCKEEMDLYLSLMNDCKALNIEKELPPSFHDDLMNKLSQVNQQPKKTFKPNYGMYSTVAAVFILVVVVAIASPWMGTKEGSTQYDLAYESSEIETQERMDSKEFSQAKISGEGFVVDESGNQEQGFSTFDVTDEIMPEDSLENSQEFKFSITGMPDESINQSRETENEEEMAAFNEPINTEKPSKTLPYIITFFGASVLISLYIILKRRS